MITRRMSRADATAWAAEAGVRLTAVNDSKLTEQLKRDIKSSDVSTKPGQAWSNDGLRRFPFVVEW